MSATRTRLQFACVGALLVRTWNVAQGRTLPETRTTYLEEMIRLASKDAPDVLCLQELPVWSLAVLERWSDMRAFGARTMPELGGPLARRLTALDPARLRSALAGQANAILVGSAVEPFGEVAMIVLNPRRFRRRQAARLGLAFHARRAWAGERRVAQAVRVAAGASTIAIVNLHLTGAADSRLAEAELARALTFADGFARPAEALLLCGDLNLTRTSSLLVKRLPEKGFTRPGVGIDHILARGLLLARGPEPWPDQARRLGDVLLSDHAPAEAEITRP